MNEEFLPYEESLVLKELGFDEPCFGVYSLQGGPDAELCYGNSIFTNSDKVEVLCSDECTAILYQQAFKWFREKHDLHNGIYPYYDAYEFQIKDFRSPINTPINGGLMRLEEAELACVKKLIALVKQNNK